jgi:hypothetical protein
MVRSTLIVLASFFLFAAPSSGADAAGTAGTGPGPAGIILGPIIHSSDASWPDTGAPGSAGLKSCSNIHSSDASWPDTGAPGSAGVILCSNIHSSKDVSWPDTGEAGSNVVLSEEDIVALEGIAKDDEWVAKLIDDIDSFKQAYKFFGEKAPPGPASIMVKWNLKLIEGWQKANAKLADINFWYGCMTLGDRAQESSNKEFFEKLLDLRNCTQAEREDQEKTVEKTKKFVADNHSVDPYTAPRKDFDSGGMAAAIGAGQSLAAGIAAGQSGASGSGTGTPSGPVGPAGVAGADTGAPDLGPAAIILSPILHAETGWPDSGKDAAGPDTGKPSFNADPNSVPLKKLP